MSSSPFSQPQAYRLLYLLAALALMYTLYFARSLIVPLFFSVLLALLLNPSVTFLRRNGVPRFLASLLMLVTLIAPLTLLTIQISEPAERWLKTLPEVSAHISEQVKSFNAVFEKPEDKSVKEASGLFGWFSDAPEEAPDTGEESVVEDRIKRGGVDILASILFATPALIAQIFVSLILIIFLLTFGPSLCRIVIVKFPQIKNRNAAGALIKNVQTALSHYILTVSVINLMLGVTTATALYFIGINDWMLWGVLVAVLNFVPYLGAGISIVVLAIAGIVQFGTTSFAIIPAAVFFVLTVLEAQFVTPTVLGSKMRLNPLVIVLTLFLLSWMWGTIGVLMAVPLLVCLKLSLQESNRSRHWVALIEAK